MFRLLRKTKYPKLLVITPLKTGDKISYSTKNSIFKNKVEFDWVSYEGNYNIPTNTEMGLNLYNDKFNPLPYCIKVDNDVKMDKGMLDDLFITLSKSDDNVAYCYPPFKYILSNQQVISFENCPFDKVRLLKSNYISSVSLIKFDKLKAIDGFVKNSKYERLLDYCLWLKFLRHGYIGVQGKVGFTTTLNKDNVSARGTQDYEEKLSRVHSDFVNPYF
jgi:hypothetical protein